MDKWTLILLEMEEMWAGSAEAASLIAKSVSMEVYRRERDIYKAERILSLYGYECFRRFIDRCPHILNEIDYLVPCEIYPGNTQCTMFCHKYDFERGCTKYANV